MPEVRLRRYLLGVLIITTGLFIAYLNFNRIAIFAISRLYSQEISYKRMVKEKGTGLVFDDLRTTNSKLGAGFFSQQATIKPSWGSGWFRSILLDFKFKNVHFIKKRTSQKQDTYDTLSQLIAMPFEGRWMYKDVTGLVEIFSNGITVKKFSASGRDMRLILTGDIYYNNAIDVDVTILFSKDVLKEIPPELHSVIMQDEPDGWKSFSVKAKGNLSSPSLEVTGKIFRLNFGTVTVRD